MKKHNLAHFLFPQFSYWNIRKAEELENPIKHKNEYEIN